MEKQAALDMAQRLRSFYTADEDHWEIKHDICDEAADMIESLAKLLQPDEIWSIWKKVRAEAKWDGQGNLNLSIRDATYEELHERGEPAPITLPSEPAPPSEPSPESP